MSTLSSGLYGASGAELQGELLAGESLSWVGQPSLKVIFHARDAFAIPFSLLWGGFAIFWELEVTGFLPSSRHQTPGLLFALWGIPFVAMGQYMIWGRFLYTAWRKTGTRYAVTNKRVIILNTKPSRRLTDRYLRGLDSVSITERSDGIGTIEFSSVTMESPKWGFVGRRKRNQIDIDLSSTIFYDIPDVRGVYQLIQNQRAQFRDQTD